MVCSPESTVADALLQIDGLSKRFGGVIASDAISLAVPMRGASISTAATSRR
jgi:ABC-type branched-subunit amino acid transport system ATPase component